MIVRSENTKETRDEKMDNILCSTSGRGDFSSKLHAEQAIALFVKKTHPHHKNRRQDSDDCRLGQNH